MTHVITQPCCNDAVCAEVCPVDCIRPRPGDPEYLTAETLYIDPSTCIDCGACTDVCPVDAITPDDALDAAGRLSLHASVEWFDHHPLRPRPSPARARPVAGDGELRVAIVGTGASGYYAAEEILDRTGGRARVSLFDSAPTPGGLIRYGVAPDHAHTKAFALGLDRLARRPGVTLHLNVEIGVHLSAAELLAHHHAVVHAGGAAGDRSLGIPGEDLPGSHPAGELVRWYNGHPAFVDLPVDLSGERAVVIGTGNVALDVARILTTDPDVMARTDIAAPALATLRASRIREVHVVGRRGPADAAFTTPELLALGRLDGVTVSVPPDEAGTTATGDLIRDRKAAIIAEYATRAAGGDRRIVLRFGRSPVEILGPDAVTGLRLSAPDGSGEDLSCTLVVTAIGHRGIPVPGLPFDDRRAVVPSDGGRVNGAPGHYVVGWLRRGPTGGIGRSRLCAEETVDRLLADHLAGLLPEPTHAPAELDALLRERRPERIGLAGWRAIDRHEQLAGRAVGASRRKVLSVDEAVRIAAGG
ncbi:4Fe-4S binding protein [Pseudonocardia sp. WMMC193]|uniref:4Fe-4S binding protein n=1 Tax=Pseudonocardia sp. WMMC193 TaxID=2911965 RepID=UPI001F186E38|nr:4Fe-4S binding protein [Pseudonocardia sp. WMMC193]MCF7549558.1 4Fe-4S binding protein [Pseudonocardia sp. WMMC193]